MHPDVDLIDAEIREVFAEELAEQLELLRRDASACSLALGGIARSAELVGATTLAAHARAAAKQVAAQPVVTRDAAAAVRAFAEEAIAFLRDAGYASANRIPPVELAVGSGKPEKPWWRFW